jgi:hypothetical protein
MPIGVLDQREVDDHIGTARLDRHRGAQFGAGLGKAAGFHQHHGEIVARLHVLRVDRDGPPKLLDGLLRRAAPVIQQTEVVVRLDVEPVGGKYGSVLLQRRVVIAQVVVANGTLKLLRPVIRSTTLRR